MSSLDLQKNALGRAPRPTVHITPDVITTSVKRNSSHCVIAEAVKLSVANAKSIAVDIQTIRWSDREKKERYTYLTPRTVQKAIIDFDQGETLEPFSFRLSGGHTTRLYKRGGRNRKPSLRASRHAHGSLEPVGGEPPPVAKGKRRAFGLRALEY